MFGIYPNNLNACTATISGQDRSTLLAFPTDHVILIINRSTFEQKYIETTDPTSPIIALSFCGTSFLFCVNAKGILFKFQINNLNNENDLKLPIDFCDIHCVPNSISASSDTLFFQDENNLYSLSPSESLKNQTPHLLSNTHSHKCCKASPCGRALASFTRKGPPPVIWFKPFEKRHRFVLPVNSVTDFQWGVHENLLAVTSDIDGVVRLWRESTDSLSLRCIKFICCNVQLMDISFCINTDQWHQPNSPISATSMNSSVFPDIRMEPILILAGSKKGTFLIQETNEAELECLTTLNFEGESIFTVSDFFSFYHDHEIKRCITTTRFGKTGLTFYQIEKR